MAVFGGFMTIVSILGFFLTVIWFLLPFVIFSIKGRVDRSVELLEGIDRRLAALEACSHQQGPAPPAPLREERQDRDEAGETEEVSHIEPAGVAETSDPQGRPE